MSRLSREKQPEQQRHGASAVTPVDVRVFAGGGSGPGTGKVTVGGSPLAPAPGEEPQQCVLNHLHRIALATGRPVLATVHDERIGYVVPLRVDPDGSSHFTAHPSPTADPTAGPAAEPVPDGATKVLRIPLGRQPQEHPAQPSPHPRDAHEPTPDSAPTFRLRATPGPVPQPQPIPQPRPIPQPQPAPQPQPPHTPGTVMPPTGAFGPPPVMDGPAQAVGGPAQFMTSAPGPDSDPDSKPTPPRGFDAVAEAMLGDDVPEPAGVPTPLTEPLARIGEAVKEGRIDAATALAEQALGDGAAMLGPDHPEVLRLGELAAYVAYLGGDPLRAFRLSVDLVHARRRTGDAEAAYGNVQSAATAWRAVRDPLLGQELGHELIALWAELAAEPGPAAEEAEQLQSARTRMTRLAERARKAAGGPPAE
ncbi:tetratricopeptide repeat protein [Streptomyces pharetrae]|uniref:tetratricopeptide repeat protein n=1 Tax=Streptomyces pharetrae TaxID=291370 RepID=UPI003355A227